MSMSREKFDDQFMSEAEQLRRQAEERDDIERMYRANGEKLNKLKTFDALLRVDANDFGEAPNWGNVTTKQVLLDLYARIAALEKALIELGKLIVKDDHD
jgi:hypothetical protein